MDKKETLIQWINAEDKLPPIDKELENDEDDKIYSEVVLVTDGEDIDYARYIYNWQNIPDCKKYNFN